MFGKTGSGCIVCGLVEERKVGKCVDKCHNSAKCGMVVHLTTYHSYFSSNVSFSDFFSRIRCTGLFKASVSNQTPLISAIGEPIWKSFELVRDNRHWFVFLYNNA